MKIELTKKLNANRNYYYPSNDASFLVMEWLRRKALVDRDIEFLKKLGHTITLAATKEIEL